MSEEDRGGSAAASRVSLGSGARRPGAPDRSTTQLIVSEVVQGLYMGQYVPGQRLVEADMTTRWNVSRGTVREAFNHLAAKGVVTLSRHRGATIRVLSPAEMREILEVLEVMAGMAGRLAAERIGEADNRALLTAEMDALLAFEHKPASYELIRARNRFYQTLARIGGNRELQGILRRMNVHIMRVQLSGLRGSHSPDRLTYYRRVGEAVLAGNPRRAEQMARRHVRDVGAPLARMAD